MTAIIATAIRRASDRLGDQGKLAAALGMGRNNLSDWKNGHVERFDLEKLVALFDAAEMSLASLQGLPAEAATGLSPEQAEQLAQIHERVMGADALTLHRVGEAPTNSQIEDKSVSKHKPPQGKKPAGQPRRKAE